MLTILGFEVKLKKFGSEADNPVGYIFYYEWHFVLFFLKLKLLSILSIPLF